MPFGAKMSQGMFQMKMDLIMEKCPGVISIHNDILIYGTSATGMKWQMPVFERIKDLIAKTASQPLRYYDHTKPVTVQADSSKRGLGTYLIHNGQPITFASKSLTDTETRYTNIERELLNIIFTCQWFNTYVLGRPFTVESDHKPLEMIHQKSLASAPPRLQRMLLQLQ